MATPRGRFAGRKLYVAPGSKAEQQAKAWTDTRPADAERMRRLSLHAQSKWFGRYEGDRSNSAEWAAVDRYLDSALAVDAIGVLVLYWMKDRDLGSYSAGGAPSASEHRGWVGTIADAIRGRPCIVIGEPDSLSMMSKMSAAGREERLGLMRNMREKIEAAGATFYPCVGSGNWRPATEMAGHLLAIGASGFALNISGTQYTADENAYAQKIRAAMGKDARWVLDTSRNGRGPYVKQPGDPENLHWLNSPGRGCGRRPSLNPSQTTFPGCDGFLYVKTVGSSDGKDDRGHLPAGQWDAEEALGLVKRAVPAFAKTA